MKNRCLYCYRELENEVDFHEGCSQTFFGSKTVPSIEYSFDEMHELAKHVLQRRDAVPGVQAKLSMSLDSPEIKGRGGRLTVVGALGGNYIFKPPTLEFVEMPENEHLTMRMAEAFGINVVPSSLIRLASGELGYITRRVDRTASGEKIHMIDLCQITEAYDKYKSSMEKVGKAIGMHSANTLLDKLLLFELTVFSFLTGNSDMHLKNFSMIASTAGWLLAPAYDLLNVAILVPEDKEELALTLGGKKNNLKREHFTTYGMYLGLTAKQIEGVYKRFSKQKSNGIHWIQQSFLSASMKENYVNLVEERYTQLFG